MTPDSIFIYSKTARIRPDMVQCCLYFYPVSLAAMPQLAEAVQKEMAKCGREVTKEQMFLAGNPHGVAVIIDLKPPDRKTDYQSLAAIQKPFLDKGWTAGGK